MATRVIYDIRKLDGNDTLTDVFLITYHYQWCTEEDSEVSIYVIPVKWMSLRSSIAVFETT